jgi:hypothetical protein
VLTGFTPRKSPGSLPATYTTFVTRPSFARKVRTVLATSIPRTMPLRVASSPELDAWYG